MAARASTKAGNWSDTTVWGGTVPTTSDTVTITHDITYDIDNDTTVLGAITINAGGTLRWAGGLGRKALRMSGQLLQNGGQVVMRSGAQIRIHEGGSWHINNVAGSNLDVQGSIPNFETTLSSTVAIGASSISVADGSGFSTGDVLNIYDYTNMRFDDRTDEVFVVHARSTNTLYLRRLVGPEFTLAAQTASGSKVFTINEDVRAFTPGMKVIIGTQTLTVNTTDNVAKTITMVENASATYSIGTKAYQTGVERAHDSGDRVYKLFTTIVNATAGNSYIDVGNAKGWVAGDEIGIGGSTYAQTENKVINTISFGGGAGGSDRINLTSSLGYTSQVGAMVVKLNRDCVFIGDSGTTMRTNNAYIYIIAGNTNRSIRIENFDMQYVGNTASTYYAGFVNRNYATSPYTNIHLNSVLRHTAKSSNNGMFCSYSYSYNTFKNNVAYDTQWGIGIYSSGDYNYFTGNIAMKVNSVGLFNYSYSRTNWSYNFTEGCNSWGFYHLYGPYGYMTETYSGESRNQIKYLVTNYTYTPFYTYNPVANQMQIDKIKATNTLGRLSYAEYFSNGACIYSNVYTDESWRPLTNASAADYCRSDTLNLLNQITMFASYNGANANRVLTYQYGYADNDETIKLSRNYSWKFTPQSNYEYRAIGIFGSLYGLEGKTVKISAMVRKNATFNGTGPYIRLKDEFNNNLAQATATLTDTWEYLEVEYTIPKDMNIVVIVGGFGSAGNFWIDNPVINTADCLFMANVLNNIWTRDNSVPGSTGIRLTANVRLK